VLRFSFSNNLQGKAESNYEWTLMGTSVPEKEATTDHTDDTDPVLISQN